MTTRKFALSTPIGAYHDFLPACLRSLACQNVELESAFLDASGDPRVGGVADEYESFLAYRRHGPDNGQSAAIIEGWENTTGDILGWLNADDLLFPGALQQAEDAFNADPSLDVVYGHSVILGDEGQMTGYHWAVEPPGPRILEAGIISQPSCFFRRSAYDRIGGLNEDLHYTMDWDLWIRLYEAGAKFGFIDAPLSMVLWGEGTKTASFNRQRRRELSALIGAHAPAKRRRRIFQSFAIHNFLERLPSEALRTWLAERLSRGRRYIYGVGPQGQLEKTATIHFANIHADARDSLRIEFDHAVAITAITCPDREVRIRKDDKGVTVSFDKAVRSAQAIALDIENAGGAVFKSCWWL